MSYPLVEMMTWQGLGDLVNKFRMHTLGLEPVSTLWAPGQLYRLRVPYTYMWSPGLVPKPKDWGPEIDIAGFVFLDLASSFKPPKDLVDFLEAGEPPVYIGFGSIVVDDPDRFTEMIFEAVEKAGVRALVSKGWGGLGGDNTPDNIYMLENTPHDWLFPRCSAVIHHGGAGTTAAGLKFGKPTMIVPFFGDQPFWGSMVAAAGAGCSEPVPYKDLNADRLAQGIEECLSAEAKSAAKKLAEGIEKEGDGAQNAVNSFHQNLKMRGSRSMRCCILEDRVAVWRLRRSNLRLSALAAIILVEQKKITWKDLKLLRHNDWNDFDGPGEPLTGLGGALASTAANITSGIGSVPARMHKTRKRHEEHEHEQKQRRFQKWRRTISSEAPQAPQAKEHMNGTAKVGEGTNSIGPSRGNEALKDGKTQEASNLVVNGNTKTEIDGDEGVTEGTKASDLSSLQAGSSEALTQEESALPMNGSTNLATSHNPSGENLAIELAADAGHGMGKAGKALIKAPVNATLAVGQGFHNAPRLYGDTTVRRPTKITGIRTGLKAAGNEFRYGIYDGVSGLVLQPYHGAIDEGAIGFMKGMGKGFGGFILKDIAAVVGPFGYATKGITKHLERNDRATSFIRRARIVQGNKDLNELRTGSETNVTPAHSANTAAADSTPDQKARNDHVTEVFEEVMDGWKVQLEVMHEEAKMRKSGLRGKIRLRKIKTELHDYGVLENIEQRKKALEARRKGIPFDEAFKDNRESLKKTELPREKAERRRY
jgi:UDP-glucoronosyl and UDP-glucosyl transferase